MELGENRQSWNACLLTECEHARIDLRPIVNPRTPVLFTHSGADLSFRSHTEKVGEKIDLKRRQEEEGVEVETYADKLSERVFVDTHVRCPPDLQSGGLVSPQTPATAMPAPNRRFSEGPKDAYLAVLQTT
ncbi:jg12699 [Pararge aegeria aegeria]|uniref:Jg12699 protein n=1 Tax=Pararge aegeria aegeria TaxID=348720 RepID=A0A8S4RXS4_9NEOP|nr:jg12699 [Pararge aegeria aegeria]